MCKVYFFLPLFIISFIPNTFSNPYVYTDTQKISPLKRKNQIIFDKKTNNDKVYNNYVAINEDNYKLRQINELNKVETQYSGILNQFNKETKPQYNKALKKYNREVKDFYDIEKQYQGVINNSRKLQEQFNKTKGKINNLNYKIKQNNAKIKLREQFIDIMKLMLDHNNDLHYINAINSSWQTIIRYNILEEKLDKQYVMYIWKRIYNIYKYDLKIYKYKTEQIRQIEILNLDEAIKFIDNCYNKNK